MSFSCVNNNFNSVEVKRGEPISITLPPSIHEDDSDEELLAALMPLQRQLEAQYHLLPWPEEIKKIVVYTEVCGGCGDIAAAAKAIALMERFSSSLQFDWVLTGTELSNEALRLFIPCKDTSNVSIRKKDEPPNTEEGDFLLTGPVRYELSLAEVEVDIKTLIDGPVFNFAENGEMGSVCYARALQESAFLIGKRVDAYVQLHPDVFPNFAAKNCGIRPMGLQSGTGVFLDVSREALLSRVYCCPSYLKEMKDQNLQKDIYKAMGIFDEKEEPNYDLYSFNFGYAHRSFSWENFIQCVAIHEKDKHVVIVLNQKGEYSNLSAEKIKELLEKHIPLFKRQGYGKVKVKGERDQFVLQSDEALHRELTVIVRLAFLPSDMRLMQLSAERLLATGDNSAVESWCARCKLYLYEDVNNGGCKWRFLQQQVDLAHTISPNLSRLLALFGEDRRVPYISYEEKLKEIEDLLQDPHLGEATLQFCNTIVEKFSFNEILEDALKRVAWHYVYPKLAQIEAGALNSDFGSPFLKYLRAPTETTLTIHNLSDLAQRIEEYIIDSSAMGVEYS